MTKMIIRIHVGGGEQLEKLAARFERAVVELPRELEAAVRGEGDAAVSAVRAAWMGVEVTSTGPGGEHSGLRARVAAATRASAIPSGVRIEVDAAAVDPRYGNALVKGLNGLGTWTHPIFGTSASTVQRGQEVFFSTLRGRAWGQQVERVVDRTARQIEG